MRALSIRQPYAELILRGIKTIEFRSRATKIIGERFWIYASKRQALTPALSQGERGKAGIWSTDLSTRTQPPPWIVELANAMKMFGDVELPTGVIVGSAVIEKVVPPSSVSGHPLFEWHLGSIERIDAPLVPAAHPQPVWFNPF